MCPTASSSASPSPPGNNHPAPTTPTIPTIPTTPMKRRIFFTLLAMAIATLTLRGEEAAPTDSIIVAGRIRNIADGMPHTVIVNECDISAKRVKEICELDEAGGFCCRLPLSFPHTFTINYNRRNFINVFAAPGDSIFVEIDPAQSPVAATFSGEKDNFNNQYNTALHHLLKLPTYLPSDSTPLDEYMPAFKRCLSQRRDSIDSYARIHNLTADIVEMLNTENLFGLANQAISFTGSNLEEQKAFFLDSIFDLYNENNTKVMIFPFHISAIVAHFPEIRDSAPKGLIRDLMYACDETISIPERGLFFNQGYYDRLYSHPKTVEPISISDISPGAITVFSDGEIQELTDVNPLNWLMTEYKGCPIYLDVSATWCGPCRAALRNSESLRKHFIDSDIKFAILWLSSQKEEWLKLAPTISNGIQIFVDDAEMSDRLTSQLSLDGFPSYYMINRAGAFSKEEIPGYSSPDLPLFLNTHRNPTSTHNIPFP